MALGLSVRCDDDRDSIQYSTIKGRAARAMRAVMLRSAVQNTQLNLNYVRTGTNFGPFPPPKEQSAIAEYLDAKEREFHTISNTSKRKSPPSPPTASR